MKKTLFIFFLFIACTNQNNESKEIGNLSILEYPDINELNRWIELDSQYANVFQVRRYFENFVKDEFFEEEENKRKFNNITWLDMSEYQKKYTELLNKYEIYRKRNFDIGWKICCARNSEFNKEKNRRFRLRNNPCNGFSWR